MLGVAATTLHHPFAQFAAGHPLLAQGLGLATLAAVGATLLSSALRRRPSCPHGLRTPEVPGGIVSFELAWSRQRSDRIVDSWSPRTRRKARTSLFRDFGFIVLYSTLFAFLAAYAAAQWQARGHSLVAQLAVLAAWGAWVAGLLDVWENLFLLRILGIRASQGSLPSGRLPAAAAGCASIKFGLVLVAFMAMAPALFLRAA